MRVQLPARLQARVTLADARIGGSIERLLTAADVSCSAPDRVLAFRAVKRKAEGDDVSGDRSGDRDRDHASGLRGTVTVVAFAVATAIGAFFLLRREDYGNAPPRVLPAESAGSGRVDARPRPGVVSLQRKPYSVRRRPPVEETERTAQIARGDEELTDVDRSAREIGGEPELRAEDYIAALRASGETGGLAAFPPPGTNPPRSGVVVPEGYSLPEGFARHYQATDDGQQLNPILIVAPGYQLVDDEGEPVVTDGLTVPPEYAPADMPLEMLEIPDTERGAEPR